MTLADDFRRYAKEYFEWARRASTLQERKAFLDCADKLLRAAAEMETASKRDAPKAPKPPNTH